MSTTKELVVGLNEAIELERSAMEFYQSACRAAGDHETATRLGAIEHAHMTRMHALEQERERIQDANGEGVFGETLEAVGRALSGLLAGLPVSFIENETRPTTETLRRLEEELLGHYQRLLLVAGPDTRVHLEGAITSCRDHIAELEQITTL